MTIQAQSPQYCDRIIILEVIFYIMAKLRLLVVSSFSILFSSSFSFLDPVSGESLTFPMWKSVSLCRWSLLLALESHSSRTHAWFLPALLSWDLLKSPQCLLSPYLMNLHLFPSLLNISKRAAYILQLLSSSPTCLLDLGQTSGHPWPTVF